MRSLGTADGSRSSRSTLNRVVLLWLAGNGMRMTILAVPPLIPLIHRDLQMSETEVGILAGLPVVLFACAAIPGSLLIVRFGAATTVVAGLLITASGSALRGTAPNVLALYAATVVTGFGVALMHPSMPPLAPRPPCAAITATPWSSAVVSRKMRTLLPIVSLVRRCELAARFY
jgi:cyanate permease